MKISPEKTIRLNKYLADLGLASRRKIPEILSQGRVRVNGRVAKGPGLRIDPEKDEILVDNKPVLVKTEKVYFILNKPKGVVSTVSDEHNRPTVVSLVNSKERLYPVGRLDINSTGLVLLTNDGELANLITHPRYHLPKTYQVVVGQVEKAQLENLRQGVNLKEGKTAPAEVEVIKNDPRRSVLQLTVYEGRNHLVKKICAAVGLEVIALKRIAVGPLKLGDLKWGQSRQLNVAEVVALKKMFLPGR